MLRARSDGAQKLLDAAIAFSARVQAVDAKRFGDDVANGHARVQRRVWILEDDLDVPANRPHLLALETVMSRPSNTILPEVGSTSFMMVRPRVVLPHPGLADHAERLAGFTLRLTPSTARTCPTVCLKNPALIGKCLTSSSMRSRSWPFEDGAATGRRAGGLGLAHEPPPAVATGSRTPASSSAK